MTKFFKDANDFPKYSKEHDEIMRTYNEPIIGAFGLDVTFPFSVKVMESLTFVEFKSGWDQDDYIHNDKATLIANDLGLEFQRYLDYPRYSANHCECALRYLFKNSDDAWSFAFALESATEIA